MLLTFLSRYLCTIGHLECLALGSGLPRFRQGFSGPVLLGYASRGWLFSSTGLSPSMVDSFQSHSTNAQYGNSHVKRPTTPTALACCWFRLFPFRSPLLRESHSLSSPPLTEMFQFSGLPLPWLYIHQGVTWYNPRRVAPFGDLRIIACKRLPEAFRCLLRPSSAPSAKASTVRPF